jgi:hypothetical protein
MSPTSFASLASPLVRGAAVADAMARGALSAEEAQAAAAVMEHQRRRRLRDHGFRVPLARSRIAQRGIPRFLLLVDDTDILDLEEFRGLVPGEDIRAAERLVLGGCALDGERALVTSHRAPHARA